MSRSRKKHAVSGMTCAETDKPFKKDEHRRERRNTHQVLDESLDGDDPRLHSKTYGDPWASPKDGRYYYTKDDKWFDKVKRK